MLGSQENNETEDSNTATRVDSFWGKEGENFRSARPFAGFKSQKHTTAPTSADTIRVDPSDLPVVSFDEPVDVEFKEAIQEINAVVSQANTPALDDMEKRDSAAAVGLVGKYEPKLTENGIPVDVLEKLLPGDGVIEISEPVVADGIGYRFIKRLFDILSCGLALIILAIPMGIIAIKIKMESEGPAIYAQRRVGKRGKIFNVYKFRSMYVDAESRGAQWAQGDDPRVTTFGKMLRQTRMDELPQFWNILKGDMSLIGPRPERPAFCNEFEKSINGWHYRTKVAPGLSGLAQVSGGYELLPCEKVLLDMEYIEHRSIAMDYKIIRKTLSVIFSHEGAR